MGLERQSKEVTLATLISKYNIRDGVLKIDIEGGEFGLVDGLQNNIAFEAVAVKYYRGYENIASKLESLGYGVTVTKPRYWFSNMLREFTAVGLVVGVRNN